MYNLFEAFALYFPGLATRAVEHKEVSPFELVVKLNDESAYLYSDMENSIRRLPSDSNNMTEKECRKEFGWRLGKILYRYGISQSELSERTGITQAMISRYINGTATPSLYNADKIAKAVGCSLDDLRYCE